MKDEANVLVKSELNYFERLTAFRKVKLAQYLTLEAVYYVYSFLVYMKTH
jgi:hypothetical protein